MNIRDPEVTADGVRHGRPVAGQQGDIRNAQVLKFRDYAGGLRPHAVARADRAKDVAIAHDQQRRLTGSIQLLQDCQGIGGKRHAALFEQSGAADQNRSLRRPRRHSGARMRGKLCDGLRCDAALGRRLQDEPGQRMFAFLLGAGRSL